MINRVRGRLTVWYVSLLALVLVAFSGTLYILLSRSLYNRVDNDLNSAYEAIMAISLGVVGRCGASS
jgi:hypothetical protein